MAPFRPSNLNKREYPGNGSVIGPTVQTSCSASTTVCSTIINCCAACAALPLVLGCRCSCCGCPCCDVTCTCNCTVCDRTVPSGMWKSSEVYEARSNDSWGNDTSSNDTAICVSNANNGYADTSELCNYGGFFICCGPSTSKWFVAPDTAQYCRTWHDRSDTVSDSNSQTSCGDYFFPTETQLLNPGYDCRTYWDSYCSTGDTSYWSDTERNATHANTVLFASGNTDAGGFFGNPKNCNRRQRAFRCQSS